MRRYFNKIKLQNWLHADSVKLIFFSSELLVRAASVLLLNIQFRKRPSIYVQCVRNIWNKKGKKESKARGQADSKWSTTTSDIDCFAYTLCFVHFGDWWTLGEIETLRIQIRIMCEFEVAKFFDRWLGKHERFGSFILFMAPTPAVYYFSTSLLSGKNIL